MGVINSPMVVPMKTPPKIASGNNNKLQWKPTPKANIKMRSRITLMELSNINFNIPDMTNASFGKLILDSMDLEPVVLLMGALIASVIIDQSKVPEKA